MTNGNLPPIVHSSKVHASQPGNGSAARDVLETEIIPIHPKYETNNAKDFQHNAPNSPFVITLANQKGGVAKTTSVVSLAGAFILNGLDVLVMDLDAQANLTMALGKDTSRIRNTITDVLFNNASLVSISRETHIKGLDIAPADAGMELTERFLSVRKNYEDILRLAIHELSAIRKNNNLSSKDQDQILSNLTGNSTSGLCSHNETRPSYRTIYDLIILDCPPSMGAISISALVASDLLIIPTQPEYFSAHALRSMMGTIQQIRNEYNPKLAYRILITMFDQRNRIHRQVENQIRDTFKQAVFETTIGVDTKLRECALQGFPITHQNKNSRSSLQYQALAQELKAYVQPQPTA